MLLEETFHIVITIINSNKLTWLSRSNKIFIVLRDRVIAYGFRKRAKVNLKKNEKMWLEDTFHVIITIIIIINKLTWIQLFIVFKDRVIAYGIRKGVKVNLTKNEQMWLDETFLIVITIFIINNLKSSYMTSAFGTVSTGDTSPVFFPRNAVSRLYCSTASAINSTILG